MKSIIGAPRLLADSSAMLWDARSQAQCSAAHAVLHTLRGLAPQDHRTAQQQAADGTSDLLGIQTPQPSGKAPPSERPSAAMGSRQHTGPVPRSASLPVVQCSFAQAAAPMVPHMASLSADLGGGAGSSSGAVADSGAAATAAGSGGYLNKLGRKLKHSIASSSLGQAVGREVRHIRSDAPSQAAMWQPHESLLRQGGESLGERLARELQDAYSKARSAGYFDEAHVQGSIMAFLALLLSSAHTAVQVHAAHSGAGASLEWVPEHFAQSVMDARIRLLVTEMSSTQLLSSFALGMCAAHGGLVPAQVRDATVHPQLHKQGHYTNDRGQRLYLSTLLSGQQLLEDATWRVALGSDAALRRCSVAAHTFGDVRRRVQEALHTRGKAARSEGVQHLLVAASHHVGSSGKAAFSQAMMRVHLRVLGAFSRELGGLGLRAAAADWALWRPSGCSMSTDEVVAAANEGGAATVEPDGGAGDLRGLVDLLLAATSDSTPSSRESRQTNQLVALLSHLPAARAAIVGVALLRLSDAVAAGGVLAPVHGLPTADAIRHGAVPLHMTHLQWRWSSWQHGLLAARLLLCLLLHGAPAARSSVALLRPLLVALLQPNLGSLAAAAATHSALGGTVDGAAVAAAASMARARRSTARSIAAKVAFGLSGGRAAGSTHVADGMGSGQPLAGSGSAEGSAWCGEPPVSAAAPSQGGLPPAVQAVLQQPHCNDSEAILTAQALNVKSAVENGHGSGLGVLAGELPSMQHTAPKHGVATLKSALRLLLRLLDSSREWCRVRLAAQQAGPLLPASAPAGVVTGAPCTAEGGQVDAPLHRHVSSCHALFVPAPLPSVVDMRAGHLHMAAGQRVLHPWDLDFMQLRGQATLLKRLAKAPLAAFQQLPRVLQTAATTDEPPSPFGEQETAPGTADGRDVSPALRKLHDMFMPVGWNSRSHTAAMRMSSTRSPKYVQHIIATHAACSTLALAPGRDADTVPLHACAHGCGGQGRSKLKHRRAHSIASGPILPQEVEASDFDLFDAPAPVAAARRALPAQSAAAPAAPAAAVDDAWGSDVIAFD